MVTKTDNIILSIITALIIVIIIFGYFQNKIYKDFCKEVGYKTPYFSEVEEGYFKCCKNVYIDHIKIDEKECKAYLINKKSNE